MSGKGAQGLMQSMPDTTARMGVRNSLNPSENVEGGARYLRELLGLFDDDVVKALAASNAGPQ
jgi:soluble lytic murein transglycosylase-like protein